MAPKKRQFGLLFQRELRASWRDSRTSIIRLVQSMGFALITALIWGPNIPLEYTRRHNSFTMLALTVMFCGLVSMLVVFPTQKLLFLREISSNTYSPLTWVSSFMMVELPREVFIV